MAQLLALDFEPRVVVSGSFAHAGSGPPAAATAPRAAKEQKLSRLDAAAVVLKAKSDEHGRVVAAVQRDGPVEVVLALAIQPQATKPVRRHV
jgi:hypothetical protein